MCWIFHCVLASVVLFLGFKEGRPWNWLPLDSRLNTNQREVIKRILVPGNTSSPLVVFGPFGTGKTFTLNQAIRHLVTKNHNRILLCTHTNSAADIHVRLLHDYLKKKSALKASRPLRIYRTDRRSVNLTNLWANQAGFRKRHYFVQCISKTFKMLYWKAGSLIWFCGLFSLRKRSRFERELYSWANVLSLIICTGQNNCSTLHCVLWAIVNSAAPIFELIDNLRFLL